MMVMISVIAWGVGGGGNFCCFRILVGISYKNI